MPDLTTAMRDRVVNYLRGAGAPAAIGGIFLDLFNGDPQAAGTSIMTAITGSANRVNITAAMGASATGASTNTSTITVTNSATGAGTATHMAIYDAVTGGNLIASHALTSGNLVVSAGNAVQVNPSGVTLSIT